MARKTWVWDPDSGGVKIPESVKRRTEARLRRYAEEHFAGRYTRLEIRFRGQFCYITYSNEKYELSVLPSGDFYGTPEEAFDTAAQVYLMT
jgi:hypothetical protein